MKEGTLDSVGHSVDLPVGWLVLLALLLLLILAVVTLRLGVRMTYEAAGFLVQVRVGPWYVPVFPRVRVRDPDKEARKQRKKEARAAKKQARAEKKARKRGQVSAPPEPKKPNLGGLLSLVWELLPVVQAVLGRFSRKLRVDELTLSLTWAEDDPADTGIHYGYGWAVLETLLAFLEANVTIKHRDVALHVDFLAEKPRVFLRAGLSLTLAQLFALGFWTAVQVGKILLHRRSKTKHNSNQKAPSLGEGAVSRRG